MSKEVWTYEVVKELSKQFDSKTKFYKEYGNAYNKANKKGWLKDFYWLNNYMMNNPNCNKEIYSYDYCYSIAKKYQYKIDFLKNETRCYRRCYKKGFLDNFTWLKGENLRPLTYKEYEKCLNSLNNEYITLIGNSIHQKVYKKKRATYTDDDYDLFITEAKKYSYKQQFRNANFLLFEAGYRRGWLEDCTWFTTPLEKYCSNDLKAKCHVVYAYEDIDNKTVYVGRTCDLTRRHNAHKHTQHKTNKLDTVGQYFIEKLGVKVPEPKVLQDKLNAIQSQEQEHYWLCQYKDDGWNILNKGKTGKNIGSLGAYHKKWTFDKVVKTCMKATCLKDLPSGCEAYVRTHKLQDCIWYQTLLRKSDLGSVWTYEACYNEALKYTDYSDFRKSKAYQMACKQKWITEYYWLHKVTKGYTKEDCYRIAKQFTSYTDFMKCKRCCYKAAFNNGWIQEFTWLVRKNKPGQGRLKKNF